MPVNSVHRGQQTTVNLTAPNIHDSRTRQEQQRLPVYRRQLRDFGTQTTESWTLFESMQSATNLKTQNHSKSVQNQNSVLSESSYFLPKQNTVSTESNITKSSVSETQSPKPNLLKQSTVSTESNTTKSSVSKSQNPKSKKCFSKSKRNHRSKNNPEASQGSSSKSYNIQSLSIPTENLLHCKFHVDGQPLVLLIDTGAAISVINKDKIGNNLVNDKDIVSIVGISNSESTISTLGTSEISLDKFPKHRFHVANLNIASDGILGNDFMSRFNVNIYVQSKTMRVRDRSYNLFYFNEQQENNIEKQFLPKRSETVINCCCDDITNGMAIIDKQSIDEHLVIPNALVNVCNNSFLITCINSSDEDKYISTPCVSNIKPYIEASESFQINSVNINETPNQSTYERVSKLVRRDHLNIEECESLDKIISNYSDIFYTEGDKLTFTNHTKHSIPTTSEIPINTKTYRFPYVHQQEVKAQVDKMLNENIIRPSASPWSSPIWVVPKKKDASGKQKWRVVIDYRKLNDITIGDSYPLPNITDILDKLGHSIYFTTLDLASGFHQIELDPKDIPKTAFSTPYGHYEFLRMPFGLKNAPATFQRAMDSVLYGLQGERCFVYLDDIVIFASSLHEHEQKLTEVFERLRQHGLKIQPDKCEFLRKEVAYLGHIISNEGVKPNPEKVQAVQNFPIPKSCKDIKSFLGLAGYYRRFIINFSKLMKPLTSLLKKDVPFLWGESQQHAFDTCKEILTTAPILQYPDFSKEFVLTTDASVHAIGAILSQGEVGKDLPIAYASRTLNKSESNYSTIERELLAIVWAVKHFRPYLFGRKFKILTDHKPLTWLFSIKDPGSRLVRWRLKLEEYDYEIVYKAGKMNTNADALSRPPIMNSNVIDFSSDNTISPDPPDYLQMNYEHFLSQDRTIDSPRLKTSPDNLLDPRHKDVFIPTSCQLLEQSEIFNEAMESCSQVQPYLEKEKTIYNVDKLVSNKNQNLFLVPTRPSHFDPWDSESYFKSLLTCLQQNDISTLYVPDLKRDPTCKLHGNEQLRITAYLAEVYDCNIVICQNNIKYPKLEEIPQILKTYHDEPLSGHRGIIETTRKIRDEYFWKGMTNDIKNYVESCIVCQQNKIQRKSFQAPMVITSQSTEPFERISIDLVSYSDISDSNNKYVLTLQDDLTRFVQAYPIPDKEAVTVAKQLLHFCQHYGVPKRIHSDQGTEFTNNVLKQLTRFLGASHTFNTAYHPQANGALERFHATLRDHIRMYQSRRLKNWDKIIPFAVMCHNTSVNKSTNYTPHELLFGYKPRPFYSMKTIPDYTASDYIRDLNERLRVARDAALRNIESMKEKAKDRYDSKIKNIAQYQIGNKVMLRVPNPNNLDPKWEGPFEIIRVGFNNNYTIRKANRHQLVHADRLRPYNASNPPK